MASQHRSRALAAVLLLSLTATAPAQERRRDAFGDALPDGALARLGRVERLRQGGAIKSLALSPDGKTLAAGSSLGMIGLWAAPDGREVRTLGGHRGDVTALAFAPDGKTLASGGADGTVRLWDVAAGKEILQCFGAGHGVAHALTFSADGKHLAAVGDYHIRPLRVWIAANGLETAPSFWADNGGRAVAFAPDGKHIVTSANEGRCAFWDAAKGTLLHSSTVSQGVILTAAYAPDGKSVLAVGNDGTAAEIDSQTGKALRQFDLPLKGATAAAIDGAARHLALTKGDEVRLIDAATGKSVREFRAALDGIPGVAIAGTTVAVGGATGRLRCWDGGAPAPAVAPLDQSTVGAVALSPDGRTAATADRSGARLWDGRSGKLLRLLPDGGHPVRGLAFGPDGTVLATGHTAVRRGGHVRLWDVRTGRELRAWEAGGAGISTVQFTPDGKTLLTVGADNHLRRWDLSRPEAAPKELGALDLPDRVPVALCPDGQRVAVGTRPVRVLDVATGVVICQLQNEGTPAALAFAPDGRSLAVAWSKDRVRAYEVLTGYERLCAPVTPGGAAGAMLAYAPDGRSFAVATPEGEILVSDGGGAQLVTRRGHRGTITCLAFGPTGKSFITGSADATALLWAAPPAPLNANLKLEYPEHYNRAWEMIGGYDATMAHRYMRCMAIDPAGAVAWLREHYKPARKPPKPVAELIAELDHAKFAIREKAMADLLRLGGQVRPALQQALGKPQSLESRRRLERLLRETDGIRPPPEDLRAARVAETLELIATPEAYDLLREYAAGDPSGLLTIEAAASLRRLGAANPTWKDRKR